MTSKKRILLVVLLLLPVVSAVLIYLPEVYISASTSDYLVTDQEFEQEWTLETDDLMILGASVTTEEPSPVLRNRLETAAAVIELGGVNRVFLSGATDGGAYSEPRIMRDYLEENISSEVIAELQIIEDDQGSRTFDSCRRLAEEYEVDEVLVVTQEFHLDRSVFLCRQLGLDAYGVAAADPSEGNWPQRWHLREYFANWLALADAL